MQSSRKFRKRQEAGYGDFEAEENKEQTKLEDYGEEKK